jgi:hypothetical protein
MVLTTISHASHKAHQQGSLRRAMKAAQYEEFGGAIRVRDVPMPQAPHGGVVVEVKATGVCRCVLCKTLAKSIDVGLQRDKL